MASRECPAPVRVTVGIGSNIDPHREIRAGLDRLGALFGALELSPAYRSAAMGFDGPPFINLVARFDTRRPLTEVAALLRQIEREHGRRDVMEKFSSRTLDLDLLLYGAHCQSGDITLPRRDIVDYAYVLWPLADIAGDELHPALGVSYRSLRQTLHHDQVLERITLGYLRTNAPRIIGVSTELHCDESIKNLIW